MIPDMQKHKQVRDEFSVAINDYLTSFEYRANIELGHSYTDLFKEVHKWCELNLGQRYKDWFIYHTGNGTAMGVPSSIIHIRSAKKALVFTLRWTELINHSIDKSAK